MSRFGTCKPLIGMRVFTFVVLIAACAPDVSDAGGGGTGSNPSADVVALDAWKHTMNIADFHTANMSQAWSTMMTNDGRLCTSCHTEYGSSDEQYFFDMVVQDREILLRFFAVSNGKIRVNDDSFMRAANHLSPVPQHPAFDMGTAIGLQALRTFYMLTCARDHSLCP